ncbi:MAG: hypothetical protein ABJE66_11005 [Deltaproteobacteria bacterium]
MTARPAVPSRFACTRIASQWTSASRGRPRWSSSFDAERVREANRTAGAPFERVWLAKKFG